MRRFALTIAFLGIASALSGCIFVVPHRHGGGRCETAVVTHCR